MMTRSFLGPHDRPISAAYRVEGDELQVCYDLRPGSTAPRNLETNPGDARFLFTLKRVPADMRFVKMDKDEDHHVSHSEFAEEYWYLSQYSRTQGVFAAIDRDGDGRLSFEEFNHKSQEAVFLMQDRDADKRLTFAEIAVAKTRQDERAAAKEEFQRNDENEDGFVTFKEIAYRSRDADFWNADQNGDCALSLDEFEIAEALHLSEEVQAAFQSIDRNGDGRVVLAEFQTRSIVDKSDEPSQAN